MKFFTLETIKQAYLEIPEGEDLFDPLLAYMKHLDSIRPKLTPDLIRLLDETNLHDGTLLELKSETDTARATVTFDAADPTLRHPLRLTMSYSHLDGIDVLNLVPDGWPGQLGFGDLLNDEIDVLGEDRFEHRFIFANDIELAIRFRSFELKIVRLETPEEWERNEREAACYQDAKNAFDSEDYAAAESLYKEMAKNSGGPGSAKDLERIGECLQRQERHDEAALYLAAAAGLGRKRYRAFYLLARSLMALDGRERDAAIALNRAIAMNHGFKRATLMLDALVNKHPELAEEGSFAEDA